MGPSLVALIPSMGAHKLLSDGLGLDSMTKRLDGKAALVTGGSRGIGRAICQVFAREGANVVVNYAKSSDAAEQVAAGIRQSGGRAIALQADVASKREVDSMVEKARAEFGAIDILVNNAGVLFKGTTLRWIEDDFDRMIAVNIKGIVHCVQTATSGMIERRYGKIVNLASIAGFGTAVGETTPYALTKVAVISLTKRLALELGPHGINVNALAPGFIRTELVANVDIGAIEKKTILGRVGTPEDVAGVALFLASDESSFVTGQVVTVDGGRMDFLSHSA